MTHAPAHAHDDHAHHPPHLGHHWETPQQQFEAGKLGMWLFLATEVLLFGGLFVAYSVWRGNNPDLFRYGSHYLNTTLGAINTGVLILSSLTMAMAVTYAQTNRRNALIICLVLTFLGACGFMGIKYVEYTHKFHDGIYPGQKFYEPPAHPEHAHLWDPDKPIITQAQLLATRQAKAEAMAADRAHTEGDLPPMAEASVVEPAADAPEGFDLDRAFAEGSSRGYSDHPPHPLQDPNRPVNAHMFFNIYFMMTGLHAIHVLIGMIVIAWLTIRAIRGDFSSEYFTPVDLGGLYWHIVDLIWIFLFPLFYLI